MLAQALLWTVIAFICGSLPFSVWVGRVALRTDIRRFGDHNPGGSNVIRAGSKEWGAVALLLDGLKGAIPVSLAYLVVGLSDWYLVAVAVAPVLGHAFSPFLGFRGGKAVAVTFGIWCGMTVYEGPMVLGIFLGLAVLLLGANGWAVMLALVGLLAYFVLTPPALNVLGVRPELVPTLVGAWAGNALIVGWKHRADFHRWPLRRGEKDQEMHQ